ncbi:type II toxin-antitoxin system HicA family toxin [Candidatus Peregrinibacteria bacterium]|nr:type II toxin-antitoxin system HicA family toxin [Candidatus Peregrinibacteria bacterium]
MGSKEVEHILLEHGFLEKRQTGSHRIFFHPEKRKVIPVPMGRKDLPIGTLRSILKGAGIIEKRAQDQ